MGTHRTILFSSALLAVGSASAGTACDFARVARASLSAAELASHLALAFSPFAAVGVLGLWLRRQPWSGWRSRSFASR